MAGRRLRGQNLDDWFVEPGRARPRASPEDGTAGDGEDDDWLTAGEGGAFGSPRLAVRRLTAGQIAAAALLALVVLLIGLAAAGVFSGTASPPAAATTTAATLPTTPPSPASPPSPPAPTRTLTPGAHGTQVRLLQRALARLGHPTGTVDGQYGPATQKALKAFQTASGLSPDGILGPTTLHALTQALNNTG